MEVTGKVLGPAGPAVLILRDVSPTTTPVLIVSNDIVWWAPFALYLRDAWPQYRTT